jgi:hypothetical protein
MGCGGCWAGERWAFDGMILARHFPAVRWEQGGVFGYPSRVFFRYFLAGVGGGCAKRDSHGEDTVVVFHRVK